jgi:hypothetical protein
MGLPENEDIIIFPAIARCHYENIGDAVLRMAGSHGTIVSIGPFDYQDTTQLFRYFFI